MAHNAVRPLSRKGEEVFYPQPKRPSYEWYARLMAEAISATDD